MPKKIVIAGSSGLVGSEVLKQAIKDDFFSEIVTLVRYQSITHHPKVREKAIKFNLLKELPQADILVICLGTTRKKAKSKEAFREIDFTYVLRLAQLAADAQYQNIIVISSYGANSGSKNFYLRTKGEMEDALHSINIPSKSIIRPSLLIGKRKEFRLGESVGAIILKILAPILRGKLLKYKAIKASTVAKNIIILCKESPTGITILQPEDLHTKTEL